MMTNISLILTLLHDDICHPFVLPSERLSLWFCIVCEVSRIFFPDCLRVKENGAQ